MRLHFIVSGTARLGARLWREEAGMRLSTLYSEIAARRQAEAGDDEARQIAGTFARLAAFSRVEEEAEIASLAKRARRKSARQKRKS